MLAQYSSTFPLRSCIHVQSPSLLSNKQPRRFAIVRKSMALRLVSSLVCQPPHCGLANRAGPLGRTFGDTTYFWGVVFNAPQNVMSPSCTHSVEQLSSTVSKAGTNFTSDKRLGQSFYNRVDYVADRIADESEIRRGKQFPYQYFAAYLNADLEVPKNIRTSLHNAAEIACGNVPELPGPVVIGLDTS